jgi:hypothetical protein
MQYFRHLVFYGRVVEVRVEHDDGEGEQVRRVRMGENVWIGRAVPVGEALGSRVRRAM